MPRIVMTLLVRDEADIIADNILYHSRKGVDAFAVMDNGSTDGTLDSLRALADHVEIRIISNPDGVYQQAVWMTQLAMLAKNELGADFVISNDADEFWVPKAGKTYTDYLRQSDSVITVKRTNAVFDERILESNYHYLQARHAVIKPVNYSKQEQLLDDTVCMQLVPVGPKVIVKSRGLRRIKGGNHRAKHWNFFGRRMENGIRVIHFPIRSREQFFANIRHRASLLDQRADMGVHYKRWVRYYREGRLEEEFERMLIRRDAADYLEKIGVLAKLDHDISVAK
ncbi:MAG: glycosyltransferase family 2 protein [Gammaproteobacteria bacterium]|nr:glycosyltransferase family 2 protein [Gammaproteobacteria bacterium]